VFIVAVVYFVIDSVRNLLDIPSLIHKFQKINSELEHTKEA